MTVTAQKLSLQDYLALDDGTDTRHEFFDGTLIPMPPESNRNTLIALYLLMEFQKVGPWHLVRHKDTDIVTTGTRVRFPDLMLLTEKLAEALDGKRATITLEMPAPALVVEVVSPGKTNSDRDYRYKRSEYGARGIPEYLIIDPERAQLTVLTLVDGFYEEQVLSGSDDLKLACRPALALKVDRILAAGRD